MQAALQNQRFNQSYVTTTLNNRLSLTKENFGDAAATFSSDPIWRQSHAGWGGEAECNNFRGGGTDTSVVVQDSNVHLERGGNYAAAQNWPNAIAEYREAVRLNYNNAVAFDRLGVALTRSGQALEGVQQIKKAICIDKTKPGFRGDLGSADLSVGDFRSAMIRIPDRPLVRSVKPAISSRLGDGFGKKWRQ